VFGCFVNLLVAVEDDGGAADAEIVSAVVERTPRRDIHLSDGKLRGNHLRCDKALPDELVELELLVAEIAGHGFWRTRRIGGADGLVSVLAVFFSFVGIGR